MIDDTIDYYVVDGTLALHSGPTPDAVLRCAKSEFGWVRRDTIAHKDLLRKYLKVVYLSD